MSDSLDISGIDYSRVRLVSTHQGSLPLIITCPHDGSQQPGGIRVRESRLSVKKSRDSHTASIAKGVAKKLLEVTGESPYMVIAEFHRKYIDANRASPSCIPLTDGERCGYDVEEACQFCHEYHGKIRDFIDEIRDIVKYLMI